MNPRFCLLLSLLIAVSSFAGEISFTVASYNSVTVQGDGADLVEVSYIQKQSTSYKSRLLAGDSAILTVRHLPASILGSATVRVHSNKTSGAGSLTLRVGGQTVWHIADCSFSAPEWNGAFSADYVPVSSLLDAPSGTVELIIAASANSIYFEQLTLEYTLAAPVPHTVSLENGAGASFELHESAPGEGVLLPFLQPVSEAYAHMGWTETAVSQQQEMPVFYPVGSRYFPSADATLHALWRTADQLQYLPSDTSFLSGEYVLAADGPVPMAAVGRVSGKALPAAPCVLQEGSVLVADHAAPSGRYLLSFEADSVRITHVLTGSVVGYSGSSLAAVDARWHWQRAKNATVCFSFGAPGSEQCLLPKDESFGLYPLASNSPEQYAHLLLFPAESLPEESVAVVYTSYPLSGVGCSSLSAGPRAGKVLLDGRIVILAPDGRLFDLLGRPVR